MCEEEFAEIRRRVIQRIDVTKECTDDEIREIIDEEVINLKRIGIKEYYERFSNFLTEIIGNATEHGIKNSDINWWLWRDKDYVNKKMNYAFVDMGVGIISSYKKAKKTIFTKIGLAT